MSTTQGWLRRALCSSLALVPMTLLLPPIAVSDEAVTSESLEEYREAYIEEALTLLRDKNYRYTTTPHYKVRTDDPRIDVREAGRLLEEFHQFFGSFWAADLELHDHPEPSYILLFYSRYKYKQLREGPAEQAPDIAFGHYRPHFDIVALHTDTVGLGELPDALIHEAAHQQMHTRLFRQEILATPWVTEGLATYFENTRYHPKRGFQAGSIGRVGISISETRESREGLSPQRQLSEYKRELKRGDALPIDYLIRIRDDGAFYTEGARERYVAAWLLVHFLLHADDGAHRDAFTVYLRRENAREAGPELLYELLETSQEELQVAFTEYVGTL